MTHELKQKPLERRKMLSFNTTIFHYQPKKDIFLNNINGKNIFKKMPNLCQMNLTQFFRN